MKYRLLYQPRAADELDEVIRWSFDNYPNTASHWCAQLLDAIESLTTDPHRHGLARENDSFEVTIRQLLYGNEQASIGFYTRLTATQVVFSTFAFLASHLPASAMGTFRSAARR